MKASNRFLSRKPLAILACGASLLALVGWSPPVNEDIIMSTGSIQVRGSTTNSNKVSTDNIATIIGTNNDINSNGGGAGTPRGYGLIAGTYNNFVSTVASNGVKGYCGIIGNNNSLKGRSTLVVGTGNVVSNDATTDDNSANFSIVAGALNQLLKRSRQTLVSGTSNTTYGSNCLVTGHTNTVEGPILDTPSSNSCAIGYLNGVHADHGWTIGYSNTVVGDRGIAIGTGTKANVASGTSLGRYNDDMESNDVLVVGNGTGPSEPERSTALRITADGGVILGRVQGDIAMGDYGD